MFVDIGFARTAPLYYLKREEIKNVVQWNKKKLFWIKVASAVNWSQCFGEKDKNKKRIRWIYRNNIVGGLLDLVRDSFCQVQITCNLYASFHSFVLSNSYAWTFLVFLSISLFLFRSLCVLVTVSATEHKNSINVLGAHF